MSKENIATNAANRKETPIRPEMVYSAATGCLANTEPDLGHFASAVARDLFDILEHTTGETAQELGRLYCRIKAVADTFDPRSRNAEVAA